MAFGDIRYYNDKEEDKNKDRKVIYLGTNNINPEAFANKYNIPLMEVEDMNNNKLFYYLGESKNDINFFEICFF